MRAREGPQDTRSPTFLKLGATEGWPRFPFARMRVTDRITRSGQARICPVGQRDAGSLLLRHTLQAVQQWLQTGIKT